LTHEVAKRKQGSGSKKQNFILFFFSLLISIDSTVSRNFSVPPPS
jgi:hypothetical protein